MSSSQRKEILWQSKAILIPEKPRKYPTGMIKSLVKALKVFVESKVVSFLEAKSKELPLLVP